eukprot:scaffold3130_cov59-Cylindrotheca_fusiformis.AAC.1
MLPIDHHLQPFFGAMTPKLKCDVSNQEPWRLRSCISRRDAKSTKNVTFSDTVEESEIASWRDFSTEETTDY